MTLYHKKHIAAEALKMGEKTFRREHIGDNMFCNLTETEAIDQMQNVTLHEIGHTNKMKVWMDVDMERVDKSEDEVYEKRLCFQVATLTFVAYAAAAGWGADCLRNLSETMIDTPAEPAEIEQCRKCECGDCRVISLPDVELYTSTRKLVGGNRKISIHAVASGDRCPAGPRMCAIAIYGAMKILKLTDAFLYTVHEGAQRMAFDVVPFTSKSLRVLGSEKMGQLCSRKTLVSAYRNGARVNLQDTKLTSARLQKSFVFDPMVPSWSTPQVHKSVQDAFSEIMTEMHDAGMRIPNLPNDAIYDKTDMPPKSKSSRRKRLIKKVGSKDQLAYRLKVLKTAAICGIQGLPRNFCVTASRTQTRSLGYGNDEVLQEFRVYTNIRKCPLRVHGGVHKSNKMYINAVPNGINGDQNDVHVSMHCASENHVCEKPLHVRVDRREWDHMPDRI